MNSEVFSASPELLKRFLGYMETVKGRSNKTIEEYFLDLRTFFRFLKLNRKLIDSKTEFEKIEIKDIDVEFLRAVTISEVYEFMNYISENRDNHAAARARKTSAIRSFFKFLTFKIMVLKENPVSELETPKQAKTLPKHLTLEQSYELLNNIQGPFKERDFCMLTLFLNCGMRLSELIGINLSDIIDNQIRITGKGNKTRMVYLNDACNNAIEEYKKNRIEPCDADKAALFISKNRRRISSRMVELIVKKHLGAIGLGYGDGYSVHKLRHTAATLMYQHGHVDIRVLKDILGHENLGTTEIYTHLSSEQMQKAAEANPLANVKMKKKD
ncbi:MAG: tyrosine recombinase XerC [Oscillospiraceae bacterium]|jgi:site-specific recombinase XerD|nr:tyrosine recombinase XerC [Oscillospiraceae bacterium]